jgi:hypothetical protein
MKYLRTPNQITFSNLGVKKFAWSPALYQKVEIPNSNQKSIRNLLSSTRPFDKGVEPGSLWYMKKSSCYMLRTKALQPHSFLLYPKGDAVIPVNPRAFVNPQLTDGDILISKDSNVGECVMVDGERWRQHMFSGGVLRLHPAIDKYYLFSFLKHPIFKAQLQATVPRGATIKHAKSLWLDCLVPLPCQRNADRVIAYVSALTEAIYRKEIAIRDKAEQIDAAIQHELITNQKKGGEFRHRQPLLSEIVSMQRLDACIYDRTFKSRIALVENYKYGYTTPKGDGFEVIPGPSLEMKIIRTRIDSEEPKPGFYALILPTHISLYGTLNALPYLGTGKKLPLLQKGDIIFGEAGFHKGRSIVLLDSLDRCTTNAHGLYARRNDGNIFKAIFFRCVFNWYRNSGLIDLMAVGGSGGHFSPEYFEYLRIPDFPEECQKNIVRLYSQDTPPPERQPSISDFVSWHDEWNSSLGIWQLDREIRTLKNQLENTQDLLIKGEKVSLPT